MYTIYLFVENYISGHWDVILDLISLGAVLCGILVIISKNPIVSVLFLIGLFLNISGYLVMLGISFIGLSYLLVYVGAVSILFLFILMLINVRISELLSDTSNSLPLAIFFGTTLNTYITQILPNITYKDYNNTLIDNNIFEEKQLIIKMIPNSQAIGIDKYNSLDNVAYVTSNTWDGSITETIDIRTIGHIMYTNYSIWLIITSIILLLAMVGAIVITIKQKD
jgi:NADH-ubiquinone oxidoreductase chain 6